MKVKTMNAKEKKEKYVMPVLKLIKDRGDFYSSSSMGDWNPKRLSRNYNSIISNEKK